jgi:uncharacterized protein YhfF
MSNDAGLPPELAGLPRAEFAFPGPLRDQLVSAILQGSKVSTTGVLIEYQRENLALPIVGDRSVVVDSNDWPVAVIELTSVRIAPLCGVDLQHAVDEGEGHVTLEEWRASHEDFWRSEEVLAELGAEFAVDDETSVVLERFKVVTILHAPA